MSGTCGSGRAAQQCAALSARRSLTRRIDPRWDGDAFCGRELVKIIRACEPVWPGLDGVAGLVQELADVADALVDRFGPDAEEGGDGDLGQGEALVQDGGQEPVGEGEDGTAAGAGGGQPRPVAAAGVQACSRCWSWRAIRVVIRASQSGAGRPVSAG